MSEHSPRRYVPDAAHQRPEGVSDELLAAIGKLTEGLDLVERMRGRLYDFHQMTGHADFLFGDAAAAFRAAGFDQAGEAVQREIVGRNILDGRWTFQILEEFEEHYYEPVRALERQLRDDLMEGKRHVVEAELKEERRTSGHPDHASRPAAPPAPARFRPPPPGR